MKRSKEARRRRLSYVVDEKDVSLFTANGLLASANVAIILFCPASCMLLLTAQLYAAAKAQGQARSGSA